jgi:aspartate aminotransferase
MYSKLSLIAQSTSVAFADYVRAREAEGRKLIKMQTGDPDFPTHPNILKAAEAAMAEGQTKYCDSRGLRTLREALAAKLQRDNGMVVDPARNILITHGAVHAIGLVIRALVEPGDEVIVCEPFWRAYQSDVILAGATPVVVRLDAARGFHLEAAQVLAAVTPRTRAIVINSPNNPSGAVYGEEELRQLACCAAERGIFLISDEVYEKLVFDGRTHYSPASEPAVAKWVATAFSFSKTHAMTGWRIGYLVADESLIDELLKLSQFSVTSLAPFGQIAALTALRDPEVQAYAEKMRNTYESRRNVLVTATSGTWLEQAITVPQGTFYAAIECGRFGQSSSDLAKQIVDRWGVAFTPGIAFGDGMDNYLRMCFATSEENLGLALGALRELGA